MFEVKACESRGMKRTQGTLQCREMKRNAEIGFFTRPSENEPKEDARAPRTLRVAKPDNDAAPHTAMLCCCTCSGTHPPHSTSRFKL